MNNFSTIISIVCLIATSILSYLFFTEKHPDTQMAGRPSVQEAGAGRDQFRIAYFDMDSLENNYQYFKDVLNKLKSKEDSLNTELAVMEKKYQQKIAEWQQKGNTMSQSETEAANREYQQMQQAYAGRREQMNQTMENMKRDQMSKIRARVEEFLKTYNADKKYAYIISYTPEIMFYKDTIYNITGDLIQGLNQSYKKK